VNIPIFIFSTFYKIYSIPFSNLYTFFLSERQIGLYIAYGFSWLSIFLCVILFFYEIKFLNKIFEQYQTKDIKSIKLTIGTEKALKGSNFNESNQKDEMDQSIKNLDINESEKKKALQEIFKIGKNPLEIPFVKIILIVTIIILLFIEMNYYLPFIFRFPSYHEIFNDVGEILSFDYYIFCLIMGIFTFLKIVLTLFSFFGSFLRSNIIKSIVYLRDQQDLLDSIIQNLNKKLIDSSSSISHSQIINIEKQVLNTQEQSKQPIKPIKPKKYSILNTPIEQLKEINDKKRALKAKIKYLKERENLLKMMERDKLINFYGKKGYKKYLKKLKSELKMTQKLENKRKEKINVLDYITLGELHGYSIIQNSQNQELSKGSIQVKEKSKKIIDQDIKNKIKEEKSKRKKSKMRYDFR